MYYKKEKQFIYFGENDKKVYAFDCNNQIFLGIRGVTLKAPPIYFKKNDFSNNRFMSTLKSFLSFIGCNNLKLDFNKIESIVEATNLDIHFDSWSVPEIIDFLNLPVKDIVYSINTIKEKHNINNTIRLNKNIVVELKVTLVAKKLNLPPTITDLTLIEAIENNKDFMYYMYELQAMSDLHFYLKDYIKDLLTWCKILNEPVKEKGKTFFEYYIKIKKEYKAKENEILQNKLKNCNNKLKFENDNYIVIVPASIEEYKNEADNQHNCVFSCYMERVVNKETNVVFIRKKEKINESYITCEVNNKYKIVQFLSKYNEYCTSKEDLEFKNIYQQYLNTLKEL